MMHGEDLYYDHEELMTSEEREDAEYIPGRNYEPVWFRNWVMEGSKYQADAEGRKKFESRPPALGLSARMIDDIEGYPNIRGVTASQVRQFTSSIRGQMLRNLISCNDCKTLSDMVPILREEISTGVPSPVPSWYTYSTVTMGPRRIGYYACDNRGCYKTETTEKKFSKCGQCSISKYCSRDCQVVTHSSFIQIQMFKFIIQYLHINLYISQLYQSIFLTNINSSVSGI